MKTLPHDVRPYHRTPEFTNITVPNALLSEHTTKPGTWGVIHVVKGKLDYHILEPVEECVHLRPGVLGIVEPTIKHRVEPRGPVHFFVEFHAVPKTADGRSQVNDLTS